MRGADGGRVRAAKRAFRAGARASALAVAQTELALDFLRRSFPGTSWRRVALTTPGDRDLVTPIGRSAPDFFTRDLDDAVRAGAIDCAIHSAKDLPERIADDLDWFWLPLRGDPRDCLVRAKGAASGAPPRTIGVSSERRRVWAAARFPGAQALPMRGAVDDRLRQLLDGRFDAAVMAMAGLERLFGIAGTETPRAGAFEIEPIPAGELPPPEGQGVLAVTFRAGDRRFQELRRRFVKAVRFVSGGVGDAGLITVRGARDLVEADVVLGDELTGDFASDPAIAAKFVPVGKRCGRASPVQDEITRRICDEVRRGRRVARLKGGDAGLFGRLSEETDALLALDLPFVVRPGVSALTAATSPNGLLLTKRAVAAGFAAGTPRSRGAKTPHALFMAAGEANELLRRFPPEAPYAMVWDACGPREEVETGLCGAPRITQRPEPGLLVADYAGEPFPRRRRVLLTCSAAVMARAICAVEDRGWRPVPWSMIRLRPVPGASAPGGGHDAVVFTSPGAVRAFFADFRGDVRELPEIWTCGPGTAAELAARGLHDAVRPERDFSAKGLLARLAREDLRGRRVLRLRSDAAGAELAHGIRALGAEVEDRVVCRNEPVRRGVPPPAFDAAFFASASAVAAFLDQYGAESLSGRDLLAIGEPTRRALVRALRRRGSAPRIELFPLQSPPDLQAPAR